MNPETLDIELHGATRSVASSQNADVMAFTDEAQARVDDDSDPCEREVRSCLDRRAHDPATAFEVFNARALVAAIRTT